MKEKTGGSYYYTGEQKIQLEPDSEWIAVDVDQLGSGKRDARIRRDVTEDAESLRGNLFLAHPSRIGLDDLAHLESVAATQPVFRHGSTRLVVLPEVRAELREGQDEAMLEKALEEAACPVEVVKRKGHSVVLRPASGNGGDALSIANLLHEKGITDFAQARFLRIVPRPDVGKHKK